MDQVFFDVAGSDASKPGPLSFFSKSSKTGEGDSNASRYRGEYLLEALKEMRKLWAASLTEMLKKFRSVTNYFCSTEA